jgi:hypothetical protein
LFGGDRSGLYPTMGTVYPGGWLALGGGYRHPFTNLGSGAFDIKSVWSLKNFKEVDASLSLPLAAAEPSWLMADVEASWMDAPTVAFYGVGGDSHADKATFGYRPTTVGMTLRTTPELWRSVTLAGGADYVAIDTVTALEGAADVIANIGPVSGLERGPRYLRSRARLEVDSRQSDRYDAAGGVYRFEVADYSDRNGSHLAFRSIRSRCGGSPPLPTTAATTTCRSI